MYARAYLEGRLTEEHLDNYRQETGGKGLSSYCHPWLMPSFWQFPTGSMGLGSITAIYQARFMRYLENRGMLDTTGRKVWEFVGDGEMDEPESLAGLSLAAREGLDNLIFVVNCNLQRLDGPVRGNGSIIQELEGLFAGAGWNVIKVLWGSDWDPLFARDHENVILRRLHETVDGEFQKYAATDGRFNREHFFNKYPELQKLVAHMSDEDIDRLKRGGHDPVKIYAAYHAAVNHKGQPTVILAQTKKGYGMGHWGQGKMTAHQQKKLEDEALLAFRDRFALPLSDEDVRNLRFYKPADDSPEMKYLHQRRQALGGYLPARIAQGRSAAGARAREHGQVPGRHPGPRAVHHDGVRAAAVAVAADPNIGKHIVPIVADEARTFGMQALFRQVAIYSSVGQIYEPEDKDELLYYKEAKDGQILEEGITEAGAISSWIAAATSYSAHGVPMLPFYIFYSCFGFQRIGDLIWAAGDSRARGFLLGATAGRTTLSGEGLQHEDGSSHLLFSTVPNCVAYDPCFGYELTVILQDGMRRMLEEQEDVFYYVTVMNENYVHPPMPEGAREGILQGNVPAARGSSRGACTQSASLERRWLSDLRQLWLRHDPARSARRRRAARAGLERRRGRVERHQLHRAAPRRHRGRSLEPPASRRQAAAHLRRAVPGADAGPGDRRDRLHAHGRRSDPQLGPAPLHRARHRRLRPQRHARRAAQLLRGGSPPRRGCRAQGAGRRRHDRPQGWSSRRSRSTGSIRTGRIPGIVDYWIDAP